MSTDHKQLSYRPGTCYDQHHRPYAANFCKRSGFPVGLISPKGWRAPWMPDQTFFVFREDEPTRFEINYRALLEQRLADHEQWASEFRQSALLRGWNPDDPEKQANIMEIIGQKPLPIEPIVAAMQGNAWILGQSATVDPRLEPFLNLFLRPPDFRVLSPLQFRN